MVPVNSDARCPVKRRTRVLVIMALMVALVAPALSSCARNVIPESWTICVYLCGSNLESRQSWATKTLEEISKVHVPLNATVVVQAGGAEE